MLPKRNMHERAHGRGSAVFEQLLVNTKQLVSPTRKLDDLRLETGPFTGASQFPGPAHLTADHFADVRD